MLKLFTSDYATTLMPRIKIILSYVLLVLVAYGCTSPAFSVEKSSTEPSVVKSGDLLQAHVWYDGRQKRPVWLNPGLVAEFRGDPSQKSLLQKSYPLASVRYVRHSVQIWELPVNRLTDKLLNRLIVASPKSTVYSPVFHDAPNKSGSMRSLPGNIIVYLNPDWNQGQITHWMATRGFKVVKNLAIRSNVYVLKTGPGMEALRVANTLYESGEVIAAFPDWWQETAMR